MAIISAVGLGNISPSHLQRDISLPTAFSRSIKNSRQIATKEMSRASGFSSSSTAEQVTQGIDGSCLAAIVTGGSQRDRDRERAQARSGYKARNPKEDGLTPEQRRERDAKALQEKLAKKAAAQGGKENAEVNKTIKKK